MVTWVLFLAMGILIGVALGIYVSRLDDAAKRKQNALTQELQLSQTELAHYKSEVQSHFMTTAKLVNDMTESYRAVHEHLSKGAVDLCGNINDIETISFKDTKMIADTPSPESIVVTAKTVTPKIVTPKTATPETAKQKTKPNKVAGDSELATIELADAQLGELQIESDPAELDIQPGIQGAQAQDETIVERIASADPTVLDADSKEEPIHATTGENSNTASSAETKSASARHVDITESELSEIEQSRINASRMVH